jgi:predicted RNA-binding protein
MPYFTDLFTVETYEAFLKSDRTISGFRETQTGMAERLKRGDKMLAYVKGISRWAGLLEVLDGPFIDRAPIFLPENDPFVVRFRVKPSCVLPLDQAIPIRDAEVFDALSFTRGKQDGYWLGPLRRSLQHMEDADGRFLEDRLLRQLSNPKTFALDDAQVNQLRPKQVKRVDGTVGVTVPKDEPETETAPTKAGRDSIRNQADLARLGEMMGFRIWLPRNDRAAILQHWRPTDGTLLDSLPLNYDDTTLETIEQIDVLWLRGRAIQRAFEVEHSTAIYSGLLRMADLLALQPNMNIALHIVAPAERRDKVLNEIRRPVFSLLDNQPLAERCTFIAYEDLREIMLLKHLSHLSDSVLKEYEEVAYE